ncbi:Uncharacterised protein [Pragia fontium]|uniref:hypothetical protein n=1 Tax=Pragia fontium TaxID=82985 RepID=UPI000DF9246D|nr:hypothetical protein [Pragia fontium]SUB82754.1 Uncharacterised protein [Pragia fontium]
MLKKSIFTILIVINIFLITSCNSGLVQIQGQSNITELDISELETFFVINKADKNDVFSKFGPPAEKISSPENGEVWIYRSLNNRVGSILYDNSLYIYYTYFYFSFENKLIKINKDVYSKKNEWKGVQYPRSY